MFLELITLISCISAVLNCAKSAIDLIIALKK